MLMKYVWGILLRYSLVCVVCLSGIAACRQEGGKSSSLVSAQVPVYDSAKSYNGYNLFSPHLYDMNGRIVKKFIGNFVAVAKNGQYFSYDERGVMKFDWDGDHPVWIRKDLVAHHQIRITKQNTVMVVAKEEIYLLGEKIWQDVIVELDQHGKTIWKWMAIENITELEKFMAEPFLQRPTIDLVWAYHLNYVSELPPNSHEIADSRFKRGNLLLSFYDAFVIVIMNKQTKKILWSYPIRAHTPEMLPNGNILLFENGGWRVRPPKTYSQVVELNPITKKIEWKYSLYPDYLFITPGLGSAERLPNGNTLISSGMMGIAFEIMRSGKRVWQFDNIKLGNIRKAIYRIERLPSAMVEKFL